jgi:hypothetical protein
LQVPAVSRFTVYGAVTVQTDVLPEVSVTASPEFAVGLSVIDPVDKGWDEIAAKLIVCDE